MSIGDFVVSKRNDVDPFLQQVAVMKQLIQERTHPLELLRELVSNAGAQEVGASNITIVYYTNPNYGHTFEIHDDGCGMDFTNNADVPARLDRFLGLGLSAVDGLRADEFAWKGIGSKLSYQSRRIEIETCTGRESWNAIVNEPWETIGHGNKPRPQVVEAPIWASGATGTRVRVYGHPPHRREQAFGFEEIHDYLTHRTFVGFTRERQKPPSVTLTVQSRSEAVPFGFPELKRMNVPPTEGTVFIVPPVTVEKKLAGKNQGLRVEIKGFYTWDDTDFGLANIHQNTGLILSVKGIPYFTLDMRALAACRRVQSEIGFAVRSAAFLMVKVDDCGYRSGAKSCVRGFFWRDMAPTRL